MLKRKVDKDALASVLVLDYSLEPVPEAYRCQPGLLLTVSYTDYVDFVFTCLAGHDVLSTPISEFRDLTHRVKLSDDSNELFKKEMFKAFTRDLSLGIFKELYWATRLRQGATRIVHEITCDYTLPWKNVEQIGRSIRGSARPEIEQRMNLAGYQFNMSKVSPQNEPLLFYALTLYCTTSMDFVWKVEN